MRHPADNRVHFSELKQLAKSPAHYLHACRESRELTRPMMIGGVADCIVFGNRGYKLYPGKVRNGSEWEAFRKSHPGMYLPIASELEQAQGAADAVRTHPLAMERLDGCDFQRVMQWEAYGLQCGAGIPGERGGFDAITKRDRPGRPWIWDLKITTSTQPEEFSRHAWRMHWHCQGAWYLDGAIADGYPPDTGFGLIGVEATPPHCVTILELPDDVIDHGRKQVRLWAEKLRGCDESGHWPGYVQSVQTMTVPEWLEDLSDEAVA